MALFREGDIGFAHQTEGNIVLKGTCFAGVLDADHTFARVLAARHGLGRHQGSHIVTCHLAAFHRYILPGENIYGCGEIRPVDLVSFRGYFHDTGIDTYRLAVIADGIAEVLTQTHFITAFPAFVLPAAASGPGNGRTDAQNGNGQCLGKWHRGLAFLLICPGVHLACCSPGRSFNFPQFYTGYVKPHIGLVTGILFFGYLWCVQVGPLQFFLIAALWIQVDPQKTVIIHIPVDSAIHTVLQSIFTCKGHVI